MLIWSIFQDWWRTKSENGQKENIDTVAKKHFPTIDHEVALKAAILYSNWLTKDYTPVEQEELRDFVKARLKVIIMFYLLHIICKQASFSQCVLSLIVSLLQVFYEEELDVPLVLFNEVLDHVLRIDRIFKQPQVSIIPFEITKW